MKLETFFEKFDQFADAPDAVAKMRELVLELAVQGKVVAQNAADEPAAQLLKRVLAEKTRLTGRGDCSDEDPAFPPGDETFEIPANWKWIGATTPAVMVSDQGKKVQTKDILKAGKYPVVDQGKMFIRGYCDDSERVISVAEPIILFGDHTRETKFIDFDFVVGADGVKLLQPICIDPRFYFLVLRWLPLESRGYARHFKLLKAARIPLPPLAEQKRIVAKVDELMALCDRLALQQQERETRHAALARASLARFADAPTPANLHFLFHPSYAIFPADIRKSILTLAVQGKLVPQDTNDEPADSILRATHSFFDRLVAAKKLSAPKPLPPIEDDEVPFSLPIGWAWCRFGQIMRISSGDGLVAKDMNAGPIPVYGGNGVNGYHDAHNVAKRTLVIGRVGFYCGSIHVTPERAWVTDNAFITTFDEEHVDMDFLSWLLKATDLRERDNATAQPVISGGKVYPTVLAVPPLAEQRRIVAKVEQLMSLVDALEMQLATSCATGEKLLAAVVAELTEGTHASPAC